MKSALSLLAFFLSAFLAACGGGSTSCPAGSSLDPDSGRCIAARDASPTDASPDGQAPSDAMTDAMVDSGIDSAADACVSSTFYADEDMDGFGDPSAPRDACEPPTGFVADATDCDDLTNSVHPGATEVCDGSADDNCDGTVDEGCTCGDGDTRACGMSTGECAQGTQSCVAGTWAACEGAVGPTMERCNGLDDDCDGAIDEDLTPPDICLSAGVCAGTVAVCRSARFVCDYGAVPNYQASDESRCDGLDNDCDGSIDESLKVTYYRDLDGDGFGGPDMSMQACPSSPPAGYVRNTLDCDETCATCFTGAAESCDGLDNDCDGSIDEGATLTFYRDLDGDGHGAGAAVQRCSGGSGWSSVGDDCWDESGLLMAAAALVHPGQTAYFTTFRNDTSTFDYNCNGVDERHWTGSYSGCDSSCVGEGWTSGIPVCGASATYRRCVNAGSCSAPTETRTQECH